jgi:hypothetical protein
MEGISREDKKAKAKFHNKATKVAKICDGRPLFVAFVALL